MELVIRPPASRRYRRFGLLLAVLTLLVLPVEHRPTPTTPHSHAALELWFDPALAHVDHAAGESAVSHRSTSLMHRPLTHRATVNQPTFSTFSPAARALAALVAII